MTTTKAKPSEVDAVKDLLLWARKERLALQHVQVGNVSVVVTIDHRMQHADGDVRKPAEGVRQSIIEQYGGALFNPPEPEAGEVSEPTIEEDDD